MYLELQQPDIRAFVDDVRLRFSLLSNITSCSERIHEVMKLVQIRRQRPPSTNAYERKKTFGVSQPKASQFSMLFRQISLSPQHLDTGSIKENPESWKPREEKYCNNYLVWSGRSARIMNSPCSRTFIFTIEEEDANDCRVVMGKMKTASVK